MERQSPDHTSLIRQCTLTITLVIALLGFSGQTGVAQDSVVVTLGEIDIPGIDTIPGISGTATLTVEGDGTNVSMVLSGESVTGDHPTHIHTGTCDDFDPNPLFALTTFVLDEVDDLGVSESIVEEASLEDLLADDFVILVHKSHEELSTYLVCGEITETLAMPSSGAGPASSDNGLTSGVIGIGVMGTVCLAIAIALRRRSAIH